MSSAAVFKNSVFANDATAHVTLPITGLNAIHFPSFLRTFIASGRGALDSTQNNRTRIFWFS